MQFFTNLFVVVSLALAVISTPILEKDDSSLLARGLLSDLEARGLDGSSLFSRGGIAKMILEQRNEDVEDVERRATNASSASKTFSTLKQQLGVVSNAGVNLQSAVFELSSSPTFGQIMSVYDSLNTFTTSTHAVYNSLKSMKPITSSTEATSALDLVKPFVGSVGVAVQGLVSQKAVFLNLGIGCIIEFLLALILFILLAILEIIIILLSCDSGCVQELRNIQSASQTSIKAAISAFQSA